MDDNYIVSYVSDIKKLPADAKELTIHEFYAIMKYKCKAHETSCSLLSILWEIQALEHFKRQSIR